MKIIAPTINRYGLPLFVIPTLALSLALPFLLPRAPLAVPLLMILVPALMALLLTAAAGGREEVAALLKRVTHWRIGVRWYVVALGLALLLRLGMSLLARLLAWIPTIQLRPSSPATFLLITVLALIGALMEELGWRGYALPRALAGRSALTSALLLGIPWGAVHLGLALPGMMNAGTPWVATFLQLAALSVILTWLFVQTGGSLVAPILFHAGQNSFVFLNEGITLPEQLWLMALLYGVLALILVLIFGPNLRSSPAPQAAVVDVG